MLLAFFCRRRLGILALTPTVFRQRREASQHKNTDPGACESAAGNRRPATQPRT